ncbi:MAG: BMC domain-containing protein [Chloroflexi bacterium]|nr:BMC domain-containing protein [Chloroflexota bacterium]
MAQALGIIECDCYSDVVAAADRADKAADVRLVRQEQIGGHQVALIIEGNSDEVTRALDAASQGAPSTLKTTLVTNADPKVVSVFDLPGSRFWRK